MIKATEARTNVINHEVEKYNQIKKIVDELLEAMSKSIEFHSKNGYESVDFMPYGNSRFPSDAAKITASGMFETILKDNGYEIIQHDWSQNILKVRW